MQKRFVRFALYTLPWNNPIALPPYSDRLELVKLHSLKKRREVADLVFFHGLLNFSISCPFLYDKISFNTSRYTLRNNTVFRVPLRLSSHYAMHEATISKRKLADSCSSFIYEISKDCLKKTF